MTYRLKSETTSKKVGCFLDVYIKREEACSEGRWLLNRILNTAGIYNYLIYEWIHLKQSGIVMFLVLLTAKKLLR